jgi:hypothetical protein
MFMRWLPYALVCSAFPASADFFVKLASNKISSSMRMLVYSVTTFTGGLIWVSYLKLTIQPLLITQPGLLYSLGTNLLHLQVESKTEKEIEQRLFDLEDDDFHVREMARWKLASIGSEAVPALLHQLKTDKQHCR